MSQTAKTKKIFDGRYEILSIVGRGARSVVYHARHVSSPSSEVALKVLLNQKGRSTSGERLRKEALAMVSSRHKYVVRLDDFHSVGALCYLSMEYAPEADLRRYVKKLGGVIPYQQGELFLLQAAEALSFIHRAGILHRDLKPDNILVVNDNEIRIADFGVAVLPGEGATLEDLQSGIGTMNYMAPEVLDGRGFDARSDIYSVGVTFYEILGGVNPFERTPLAQQLEARKDEKIKPLHQLNPHVPVYLSQIINQAMSHDPTKRFPSARELAQAIMINRASAQQTPVEEPKKPAQSPVISKEFTAEANSDQMTSEPFEETESYLDDQQAPVSETATTQPEPEDRMPWEAETPSDDTDEPITEAPSTGVPLSDEASTPEQSYQYEDEQPKDESIGTHDFEPADHSQSLQQLDQADEFQPSANETVFIPPNAADEMRRKLHVPSARPNFLASPRGLLTIALVLLLAVYVLPALGRGVIGVFSSLFSASESGDSSSGTVTADSFRLPTVQSEDFSFPFLPSGLFIGSISDIVPNRTVPLTLVSNEDRDELTFVFGMEGLRAVTIHPRALFGDDKAGSPSIKPIRIASNGMMLQMTGQNVDGELFGYFKNLLNGEEGQWQARPVRGMATESPSDSVSKPAAEDLSLKITDRGEEVTVPKDPEEALNEGVTEP